MARAVIVDHGSVRELFLRSLLGGGFLDSLLGGWLFGSGLFGSGFLGDGLFGDGLFGDGHGILRGLERSA